MIKKLRFRFTAIAVMFSGIILLVLMTIVYIFFMSSSYSAIENVLHDYVMSPMYDSDITNIQDADDGSMHFSFFDNVSIYLVSDTGKVIRSDKTNAYLDSSKLNSVISSAISRNDNFGELSEFGLFYYKNTTPEFHVTEIAFANSSGYFDICEGVFAILLIMYVVIVLIIYLISKIVIHLCLKPVEKVWNQQQNFIADASHELKTPLTVVLTNSKILLAHKNDTIEQQLTWVNSTYEEGTHMKELVEKLLILAKTDNINQKKMFTTVDLSELLTRLCLQYEPVAFEKGVTLNSNGIAQDIFVEGEPTAINQMIHILIDNAIKYAGLSGTVDINLYRLGRYVYFQCRNTGEPIPAEDLPHIFERFYRADKVRTATGNSYGLGLAICKNLVDIHKGEITCTSSALSGTVFTIKLKASKKHK